MLPNPYSSGLMSQSFWFTEFKKVLRLLSDGKTGKEAKVLCIQENLFGAGNEYRGKRMAGYLSNRAAALDAGEVRLFMESDLATQKLLNLIAILRGDRLFFEFLFEVYREKIILGVPELTGSDANIFFTRKESQRALRGMTGRIAARPPLSHSLANCNCTIFSLLTGLYNKKTTR